MFKDKIKEFTNAEGNNKKKIENLIFLVVVLIVTIIIINFILKENKNQNEDENSNSNYKILANEETIINTDSTNSNDLQHQLEQIIGTIKGVGKVNVFLSYSESSKTIAMYDEKTTTSSTEESDSSRRLKEYYFYRNSKRCYLF